MQYAKYIPRPCAEQSKTDTIHGVETKDNKLFVTDELEVVKLVAITQFATHISRKYIENVSAGPTESITHNNKLALGRKTS